MLLTIVQAGVTLLLTFCFVYLVIPVLIKITYEKALYDVPDGHRKIHRDYISHLGGVALFIGIFIGFALSGFADGLSGASYLFAGLLMLFFTGLKDDLIGLSPYKKLGMELFSALIIIFGTGSIINNFYGVFGLSSIPYVVALPLTIFSVIVIVNSYNLIDGIDGLSGGIGLIASVFFAIGFFGAGNIPMGVLSLTTAAALTAFLIHNFNPASIFMGDNGTLLVGFLLAYMTIQFVGLTGSSSILNSTFTNAAAVLPVAFLAVPLYDTFTVFLKRILRGTSPFSADRDHVHHRLLRMGFTVRQSAVFLYLVTIAISLSAIAMSGFNNTIVLLTIISLMVVLLPTNGFKRRILKATGIFNADVYRLKSIRRRQHEETDENKRWEIPVEMKEMEELV